MERKVAGGNSGFPRQSPHARTNAVLPLPVSVACTGRGSQAPVPSPQELRLANSGYSGSIPETFGRLTSLTTLSLQNNNLTGRIPAGLSRLKRMYHLNLSKNGLDGAVPFDGAFLRRLGRNLDLSGNPGLCVDDRAATKEVGVGVCGGGDGSGASPGRAIARGGALWPSASALLCSCLLL
ncbi:unnamed protein product [Triticum turgidum subsp. durum]|uniref:Uncharacterized protein n=1 Tax=Triticum turgidum subsp. durum TaxID=4567 RepID=A0A9R0QDV2_TRITD|nr:unnamed protein product [Triticum turgidum subsp. durum]